MDEPRFYEQAELDRIHKMELEILVDFMTICEKNHLHYFALAGTGIGAIRHGGFIPWDDDIDIGLPRADFEKFIRIVEAEMGDKYYVLNIEHDPKFPLTSTRLCIRGTRFVERAFMDVDCPLGIFLDLYAFDNLADGKFAYQKQVWTAWFWSKLIILRSIRRPVLYQSGLKAKMIWAACGLVHDAMVLCRISPQWLYKHCKKNLTKYNYKKTKRFGYPCDTNPHWNTLYKEDTFPTKRWKFENVKLRFPKEMEKMLHGFYGDTYMQLPPEEKRKTHYPYILDFGDGTGREEEK